MMTDDLYGKVYSTERTESPRLIRLEREFYCNLCEDFQIMHVDKDGNSLKQTCTICGSVTKYRPAPPLGVLPEGFAAYDALVLYFGPVSVAEMLALAHKAAGRKR